MALANITNNILTDSGILVTNLTPTTRTLTINGTTYDLSADRSWTIATGVGGSGTTNYLPKFTGTSTIGNSIVQDNGSTMTIGGSLNLSASSGFPTVGLLNRSSDNALYMVSPASGFTLTDNSLNTIYNATPTSHNWCISNAIKMKLDASGNLGLGVSPSAWNSGYKVMDVSAWGSIAGEFGTQGTISLVSNCFANSTGYNNWTYVNTAPATRYKQYNGEHQWYNAPSGTAGNAISFTQAMTLNASGNLSIGNTNDTYKLDVSGTGRFTGVLQMATGSQVNGSGIFKLGVASGNAGSGLQLLGWGAPSGFSNWQIDAALTSGNFLAFAPSTTAGGTTFTTPVFQLTPTGAATFTGSITSTNSTGAISMVAAGSSDTKNSSASFNIYDTTNNRGWGMQQDASYKLNFWHYNGSWSSVANISGTGAATFSSSVTAGGTITLNAPSANYATLNLNGAAGYGAELKFGEATGGYLAAIRHNYNVGTGLEFYTGGVSSGNLRMYIAPSGNVGIGTTSPAEKLHTIGNIKIEQTSNNNAVLTLNPNSGTLGTGYQWNLVGVNSGSNYSFQIREASSTYLTITNSAGGTGGNVGIGTTSPARALEVNGIGKFMNTVTLGGTSGSTNFNVYITNEAFVNNNNATEFTIGTASASNIPIIFAPNATERMRITSAGEACIGRTTAYGAGFLLNVQGNIYTSAGIVTGAPSGESSATWKLGNTRTGTCVPGTWGEFSSWFTGTVANIEINGTTYTIPVVNAGYC